MGIATASSNASIRTVTQTKALIADGNYSVNEVLSEDKSSGTAWTFSNMARYAGGAGVITAAFDIFQQTTAITPRLTLYLFKATPTSNLNDNAANTAILNADIGNYVGRIDISATEDTGGTMSSIATSSTVGNLPLYFNCAGGDANLYGIIMTRDAITAESAGENLTIVLVVEQW